MSSLALFAFDGSCDYGEAVAARLGVSLAEHEERRFEGGERKVRPLENVRNRDTVIVESLAGDDELTANDRLCRLLFFVAALKEASAGSVTAVVPYLCYARKDRQTKSRDPVTTRYVAMLFEAVGVDRVVVVDVHNLAAFQNAFRCATDHLEVATVFTEHLAEQYGSADLAVVSPDTGGVKRAHRLRELLTEELGQDVADAFLVKFRSSGVVSGHEDVMGDVAGRVAVVYDDIIASGGTMVRAAAACRRAGAERVVIAATHAVFTPGAEALFSDPAIDEVLVTDTIPPGRIAAEVTGDRLVVLSTAPLVAEAIRRIHGGGSLSALLRLP